MPEKITSQHPARIAVRMVNRELTEVADGRFSTGCGARIPIAKRQSRWRKYTNKLDVPSRARSPLRVGTQRAVATRQLRGNSLPASVHGEVQEIRRWRAMDAGARPPPAGSANRPSAPLRQRVLRPAIAGRGKVGSNRSHRRDISRGGFGMLPTRSLRGGFAYL